MRGLCRLEVLEQMPPFLGGGEMIQDVFLDHSTYAEPPSRFEAGTPAIAEAIGLGAAVDYLSDIGMENVHAYEQELGGYLYQQVVATTLQHNTVISRSLPHVYQLLSCYCSILSHKCSACFIVSSADMTALPTLCIASS